MDTFMKSSSLGNSTVTKVERMNSLYRNIYNDDPGNTVTRSNH